MGKIYIALGIIALGLVGVFGLPVIFALILIPISDTIIEDKGWATIIAIFGGAILGIFLPRLYVRLLGRNTRE